jgi:DNA-binding transcriptional LysR family regulator
MLFIYISMMMVLNDMRTIDIDAVLAFILVADLGSFTRAAEASGTTQSAISLKLKRLEAHLGRRLVERNPRLVRLSPQGEVFLPRARDLLAAMQRAIAPTDEPIRRLLLGISDHVAGPEFPVLLGRLAAHDPGLAMEVRIDTSRKLVEDFDEGQLEAIVVRRHEQRRDGESLFHDAFGWFAAPTWRHQPGQPVPLVTLSTRCGVRASALRALDTAGIPWRESFVGGGTAAVTAAVTAGLGIAPLARRIAPSGFIDVEQGLGLPPLPLSDVVLYSRVSDPRSTASLKTLAAAFRASIGNRP